MATIAQRYLFSWKEIDAASDLDRLRLVLDALSLVDIRVLDHIIVGDGGTLSFAERGLL